MSLVINKLTRTNQAQALEMAAAYRKARLYEFARKWLEWARQDRASLKRWGWKLP